MLYFVCKKELFLYNYTNNLNLTSTQSYKLASLDKRVQILTSFGQPAVANKAKRHAIIIVKKCKKNVKKCLKMRLVKFWISSKLQYMEKKK